MTIKKNNAICLFWILLNGCGGSEFFPKSEDVSQVEKTTLPHLFTRPADILGGGHFIVPPKDAYREVQVEKVGEGQVRNHTTFKGGRRNVTIKAIELAWKKGMESQLGVDIHGALDIHTLTINARTVKILNPLRVPGANVVINAELLEMGQTGFVDITPRTQESRPQNSGEDGRDGERAGRIVLNVKKLINRVAERPIFFARGGRGQSGSLGRNGRDGASVPTIGKGGLIYEERVDCVMIDRDVSWELGEMRYPKMRKIPSDQLLRPQDFYCSVTEKKGKMVWPGNGEDAVAGGRPGSSGSGGEILSSVVLKNSEVDLSPGQAGEPTPAYKGGEAGQPGKAYAWVQDSGSPKGGNNRSLVRYTQPGKDTSSFEAEVLVGRAGWVHPLDRREGAWMTAGYRKMLQWYGEDLYLAHSFERAEEVYRESLRFSEEVDEESRLFVLNAQLQLKKLYAHRDFFLGSPGALPSVYFYWNNSLAQAQIDWALELLFRIRGAKKGHLREQKILRDWAAEYVVRGKQYFHAILEKGRKLSEEDGNDSLPSFLSDDNCKEENFVSLFPSASLRIFSTSYDSEEEETLLWEHLLEMTKNVTGDSSDDLSLWSQGRRPRKWAEKAMGACQKMTIPLGEWMLENRVRQNALSGLAIEAVEMYLSLKKMVFNKELPNWGELEELEREAKKILLKHYMDAVKSYQYYHLASWQGFFPWEAILSEADRLSESSKGDWRKLRTFFGMELKKIFQSEAPSFLTDTLSIRLNPEQLENLRRKERLYLNLLDGTYQDRKGVKIQAIEIRVEAEGGGAYELTVTHPGRFYIQKDEKTYYFETSVPKVWKSEGHFQEGGGVDWKRGRKLSPLLQGRFVDVFEHDSPLVLLLGGLTQLIVESKSGGRLLSGVSLNISYRYQP